MFNRLGIHCARCGKTLTGGLDTFGSWEAPLCLEHYVGRLPASSWSLFRRRQIRDELHRLVKQRDLLIACQTEADALGEYDILTGELDTLSTTILGLQREQRLLKGGG